MIGIQATAGNTRPRSRRRDAGVARLVQVFFDPPHAESGIRRIHIFDGTYSTRDIA
jgi:hypothetical protein